MNGTEYSKLTNLLPGEELYLNAIYELVHYIYLNDEAVRRSELELTQLALNGADVSRETIASNLAVKGQAILNYLEQVKRESNIQ